MRITKKERIFWCIGLLVVILLLSYVVPIPVLITNKNVTAVYQMDDGTEKNMELKIKGTYYQYIFKEDKFVGEILSDDLPFDETVETYMLQDITFMQSPEWDYSWGTLAYWVYDSKGMVSTEVIGQLQMVDVFKNVVIVE